MATPQELQVQSVYLSALEELFRHYASTTPDIVPAGAESPDEWHLNELGFGGFQMCGASILSAPASAVRNLADGAVEDPEDWLAELNNQLLGRAKNKLLGLGVTIQVSTPERAYGGLMAVGAKRPGLATWRVRWPGGELSAGLSAVVASHVAFAEDGEVQVREEGSLSLF